ncbi:beta-ketoacyl-ACP synthase III [Xanthomonas graminis]|jgi:3-oxoacyl-[acyl-carrier-protein] synthase-3|uniref:Beta-ketoacyl-[acyl-carrier-protein] synthase III n=1 Tax=Xanthomonas graminis pv. graminis TaxID=134874 RepID=A0A1M4ILP4_9XANT|nr:beta-ketoacyl-ACP synthase III [Xanthomonas translucens]EKU23948.1 3-oxoacyl-[acyl-carrier protein] synthase III [Xanthomonas translucens pv. graminis ART-Xtg29]OAX58743.1 3-oxoacyl-ACP synthase [Xanthomonas translucens pv. graminis]UKE55307.1 ketoacyl-ACP synthase III [Xanthomonas translucens pv. graminis]WIH09681.1 ketoacyl-ACP synthase III [Xanthomonas translucens pv. graminis]WIH11590.1 ketoacyl-ACP synthase III [Xanthomonas translucens pv. graminis]
MSKRIYSRIAGTGSYLPEKVLTNDDLSHMVDTSDEWIRSRTGIRERHIAAPGQTAGDLGYEAALKAIEAAGIEVAALDMIVVGTTTPDLIFPSTACLIQARLGAVGCAALDVNAACSGFLYALSVADKFIRCGDARTVLVIGTETLSRIVDWTERATCVLFGDGAGAVVLRADADVGILSTHLHADGSKKELLWNPVGIATGLGDGTGDASAGGIQMKGSEVFKYAVKALDAVVDETLHANGLNKGDLDWLIPHQANLRIIEATAKRLELSMDQVVVTVDMHGNTSSASVPMALDVAVRSGRVQRGQLLLLEAFGGGFTWGSALLRY